MMEVRECPKCKVRAVVPPKRNEGGTEIRRCMDVECPAFETWAVRQVEDL